MVNNVNAWVHYAAKRFYGMIGDGERGTVTGEITKRGYILSQYAKYTIGATRIEDVWTDPALKGTSYLSVTGDSVIVALSNSTNNSYTLTVDLPFNTTTGSKITTSATFNNDLLSVNPASETYRPKVSIDPSSFTTLIFKKSSERPPVQMTNAIVHFNKIEDQQVINPAQFGADYQLSGKTGVVFNHQQQKYLISANTDDNNGYLLLNDRYNKLVFRINSLAGGTSGNTSLYYINSKGEVKSFNYGNISITGSNFDWILDISRNKLTDGCTGIIGIRNSNYGTVLNFNFGDVYFLLNNEKMHKFTGTYDGSDEDLSSCLEDPAYVSLDFSDVADLSGNEDWRATAANKNCIFYIDGGVSNTHANIVAGNVCHQLELTEDGGYFYAPAGFTATGASYACTLDGYKMLTLPFEADIPAGLTAYTLTYSNGKMVCSPIPSGNKIPANTPVLIAGTGTFILEGTGAVSTPKVEVDGLRGAYITTQAPVGSYYLKTVDGVTEFHKVAEGDNVAITPFGAYLIQEEESAVSLPLYTGIDDLPQVNALTAWTREGRLHVSGLTPGKSWSVYNLSGRLVYQAIADSDKADVALALRGVYVVASESQRVKVVN
jgi:glucuronoarabinoxylan endo-1,4-beta-xylanase